MSPKWKQKWKRRRPDASYSLVPGALEKHPGLSRPAFQMSSPGTARLDPHYHSLQGSSLLTASLYSSSLALQKKKKYNEENQTRCMPNKILLQVLFRGCSRPSLGVQGRSDRSGFLFEGMLTRNRRGSPPVFFIWLHQQPSLGQHHVTENSVKHTRWHAYFLLPHFKIKHYIYSFGKRKLKKNPINSKVEITKKIVD